MVYVIKAIQPYLKQRSYLSVLRSKLLRFKHQAVPFYAVSYCISVKQKTILNMYEKSVLHKTHQCESYQKLYSR